MSLELSFHPFASYCQKVLVGLYETDTKFEGRFIDLGNPEVRTAYLRISPFGKMPALRDLAREVTVFESTSILEYLHLHYPQAVVMIPRAAEFAYEARRMDRLFDCYIEEPMQKVVGDALRPADSKDPFGVESARRTLTTAYALLDDTLDGRTWAAGEDFTIADCSAAPALYYANKVLPFGGNHPRLTSYFHRLLERPSFARVLLEAEPFKDSFPLK